MSEALGRYTLDRKIAEGGMAEVFLARQSGPQGYQRVCVVKRMLPAISDDMQMVQMFLNEARLAAQLSHPNIAQIYDFGHVKDSFFLAMEYVPGCSLRALIDRMANRNEHVPFPLVARLVSETATALSYAHTAVGTDGMPLKLIHRDVSPHNILLSRTGAVKLIDFGIAKAATIRQQTVAGTIKGKFAYMSPEQIRGDPLDQRTDIYSLGLVLYELLTNTRAFDGVSDQALMEAVYFARFVPPTMIRPDIPLRLLEVLSRTVVKDREARYASAADATQALERYISETGTPISTRQLAELVPPELEPKRKVEEVRASSQVTQPSGRPVENTVVEKVRGSGPTAPPSRAVGERPTLTDPTGPTMTPPTATPPTSTPPTAPESRFPDLTPRAFPETPEAPAVEPRDTLTARPALGARPALFPVLGAAAALLVLGGVTFGWLHRTSGPGGSRARQAVAVLEFQNLTGHADARWLSTALAEMLGTELAASGSVRIISADNVARARAELALAEEPDLTAGSLARLRQDLGADWVLSGAHYALGDKTGGRLRVDVKVRRASDGETLVAATEQGTEAELPDLVARLGRVLRRGLGIGDAAGEVVAIPASTPEATRLYADGLAALRRYDALGARDLLEKAVAARPDNPLPYAALSAVWAQLGSDDKAAEMAKKAVERSAGLAREERLAIQARDSEMSHDWGKAKESYRALWTFFPDDVEYGLGLARVQYGGGDGQGALATLAQLRSAPPGSTDARVDLEEAKAAVSISDYKRARDAAVRAGSRAQASGSKLLQGQSLLWEGWAAAYLGDNTRASAAEEEARALCDALGDRACVARALDWAGTVYNDQGDYATASDRLNAAIKLSGEIGDGATHMGSLNNLALVEMGEGHLARARELLDEAVSLARSLAQKRLQALFTDTLARVLLAQGLANAAARAEDEALPVVQGVGDRGTEATLRATAAAVDLDRGFPATARSTAEKALGVVRELKMQTTVADALRTLATSFEEQDEPGQAKKLFDEEAQVMQPLGEQANLANNQVAHGRLLLAAGDGAQASALGKAAAAALHAKHAFDDEVTARVLWAAGLRAQANLSEARTVLDATAPLARASENPRSRIRWLVEVARLDTKAGHAAQALEGLEPAVADAHRLGLVRLELEARLALAEIQVATGQRKKGMAALAAANKDALAHGLQRLARLSSALPRD